MSDTLNFYTVTINFAGYLGADQDYDVYAKDRDSAIEEAREEARMDLSAESIEQISDDEWEVELGFAGLFGVSEFYTVYADSEDDAEDKAKDEAYWDLSAAEINGVLVDDFKDDAPITEDLENDTDDKTVLIDDNDYNEYYVDSAGNFGQDEHSAGETYSLGEIKNYWNQNYDSDYVLSEYDSFEDWWADTKQYMEYLYED